MEVLVDKVYTILCSGSHKAYCMSNVTWPGTYMYSKMNCFTWYKKDNDFILPVYHYNNKSKTGKLLFIVEIYMHRLLSRIYIYIRHYQCFAVSVKFNGITK